MKKMQSIVKDNAKHLLKSQNGFGIKEIAIALGSVIIVGVFIGIFKDQAKGIFDWVWQQIQSFIGSNIK